MISCLNPKDRKCVLGKEEIESMLYKEGKRMKSGFYTALGTPLDQFGDLVLNSFTKQIEDQISAGASGLLIMGSMGIEPCIKESEYSRVAKEGVKAVKGKCPVFVGAMDNSIFRVKEKIKSIDGLKIDGVVLTTPFYYTSTQDELLDFFKEIAYFSTFPVYLYDLPGVTKVKIDTETVEVLMSVDNIKGIKTGDIVTAKKLSRSIQKRDDFSIMFSGLDIFDIAYKYGIEMNLDGMFTCTAPIAAKLYSCLRENDYQTATKYLDQILRLRGEFIKAGIFEGFSYSMNLLGYEGKFTPDYIRKGIEHHECKFEGIKECMKELGLI